MTNDDDAPLTIRKAHNACCPDCNIHNGYCYEMHEYIVKEEKNKSYEQGKKNEREKCLNILNRLRLKSFGKLNQKYFIDAEKELMKE